MYRKKRILRAAGVAAGAAGMALLGLGVAMPSVASAQTSGTKTYLATLKPVPKNGQTSASGTLKLVLHGNVATITEHVQGLAATFTGKPFPHVQHIHGLAKGVCPTTATKTTTGVISVGDAAPTYGGILTTLSVTPGGTTATKGTTITVAPKGASYTYSRTITLNAATMKAIDENNAVIVVHGLTPNTAPKAGATLKSTVPGTTKLPMDATAPAICGSLVASQMTSVPSGAPQTGGGSTAGFQDGALLGAGGGLVVLGAGVFAVRRRLRTSR
jgi:hypothetical protein